MYEQALTEYCPVCKIQVEFNIRTTSEQNTIEKYMQPIIQPGHIFSTRGRCLVPFIVVEVFISCKYCHHELKYKRTQLGLSSFEDR